MRLVDADMVIKTIPTEEINARMALATAPTIDAEPTKHGHWIKTDFYFEKCSNCGDLGLRGFRYCPNCGAKMDEVEEDGR